MSGERRAEDGMGDVSQRRRQEEGLLYEPWLRRKERAESRSRLRLPGMAAAMSSEYQLRLEKQVAMLRNSSVVRMIDAGSSAGSPSAHQDSPPGRLSLFPSLSAKHPWT